MGGALGQIGGRARNDVKEFQASFREKRDPEFTGRTTQMPPFYPWLE